MTKIIKSAIFLMALIAAPFAVGCDYPNRADVPDGATASKEEMIVGQRGIKSYMSAMEEYLSCIEAKEQQTVADTEESDATTKQQLIDMYNKKYNAAVDEMNLVAEEFNAQVRAYKERSK